MGKGKLHRAFSVFVVNKKAEMLIQKRSRFKRLWPGFWSNTCCSHFTKVGNEKKQAERRLKQEMGFSCPLKFLFKLRYKAKYKRSFSSEVALPAGGDSSDGETEWAGSENEITYVFLGRYDGKVKPNPKEVAEYRWVKIGDLRQEIKEKLEIFTPWFRKAMRRLKVGKVV